MTKRLAIGLGIVTAAALAVPGRISAQAPAQVVQLPTFSQFRVSTTVLVPDRGGALLGGIKRGADGRVERGVPLLGRVPYAGRLFNNHAIGSSRSPAMTSVHAYIINYEEMEEELLAEARRIRARRLADTRFDHVEELADEDRKRAEFLSRNIGRRR